MEPIRDLGKVDEMKSCLKHRSLRNYFLFVLGINVGLRISDLLPLRVQDVRGKIETTIQEQKTGKRKEVYLHFIQGDIAEYTAGMADADFLFPSRKTDAPISRVQAYRILSDCAKKVGLEEIGTHTLRKTFGYHFYKRTKDIAHLQDLFNHSAPSITLRYIGINKDTRKAAMEKFGGL